MATKKLASSQAIKKLREESGELRREVSKKTATYVAAALGLVVGLAWNEAIKSVIEYLFPFGQNTMTAKIIYAAFMTMVLVLTTVYIFKEPGEKKKS